MANEYLNNKTFESIIHSFQYHKRQKSKYELIVSELKETRNRRVLVYNDDFKNNAVIENEKLYKSSVENYKLFQEQLAYAFYVLSENIANYSKFSGIDVDDAIQEGVLICFEKIDRFDSRKGKAFNYMTTCILNHFRQLYRSARNYNELKKRYHIHLQEKLEKVLIRKGKDRHSGKSNLDKNSNSW